SLASFWPTTPQSRQPAPSAAQATDTEIVTFSISATLSSVRTQDRGCALARRLGVPGRLDDEETVARAATRYTYCMLRFCSPLPDVTCCKYNRFPTRTQLWQGKSRRRKDGTDVSTTARGVVERLYCFPDVFHPMIDRLAEFVVPYRQAL